MLKATFLVPYPSDRAPGQRFRFEQWLRLLPRGTIDATIRALFSPSAYAKLYTPGGTVRKAAQTTSSFFRRLRDVHRLDAADVVFLYREAFPLGPPVLERMIERRIPFVYDFDDAIWLGGTSEANRSINRLKQPTKTADIVKMSAATTVGNSYLANYARNFSQRVTVIPTTLDTERYRPVDKPRHPRLRIGWSGSPTTAVHLRSIDRALTRVLTNRDLELRVLGAPGFSLDTPGHLYAQAWRAETEKEDVGSFDIGLMPLPDDEWTRGKCGFKALLYMALGVATIASPVGANREIVRHGENGLLAATEDEWVDAIELLASDRDFRNSLASEGRATVEKHYSGQRWAPTFLATLESAANTIATA